MQMIQHELSLMQKLPLVLMVAELGLGLIKSSYWMLLFKHLAICYFHDQPHFLSHTLFSQMLMSALLRAGGWS